MKYLQKQLCFNLTNEQKVKNNISESFKRFKFEIFKNLIFISALHFNMSLKLGKMVSFLFSSYF